MTSTNGPITVQLREKPPRLAPVQTSTTFELNQPRLGSNLLQALLLAVLYVTALSLVSHGPLLVSCSPDQLDSAAGLEAVPNSPLFGDGPRQSVKQETGDVIAIKEGADLDLSCPIVVQNEDMIISWTCENEPANIRSSRIHVTESGKLRIHSAKVGDSCNYRCEAADGFGTLSVIIKVVIVDQALMDQLLRRAGGLPTGTKMHQIAGGNNDAAAAAAANSKMSSGHQKMPQDNHDQHYPKVLMDGGADIEIQIEPAQVRVAKNKTVALECRIKHVPHMVLPQIIWLKEYIGAGIGSIDEALDKNLISLDGIYYHSLNWPRAITYSHKSSTASSALLIRQSNHVHSGRYVCFAGYPASIMNLHFNNSPSSNATTQQSAEAPSDLSLSPRSSLKYKMAHAMVKVDDAEGEASYKSAWLARGQQQGPDSSHGSANIFVSVITRNSWMRNLTLAILASCGLVLLAKFIQIKRRKNTKKGASTTGAQDSNIECQVNSGPAPLEPDMLHSPPAVAVAVNPSQLGDILQDRHNLSHVPANSLITSSNHLDEEYKIDQDLLNERLNYINMTNSDTSNDHVYSEIGYQITMNNHEEPYYKQPIRKNKL